MPLAIIAFGVQNAGKSETWRRLVPGVTQFWTRRPYHALIGPDESAIVHIINSSAEEERRDVFRLLPADAQIVCCSVQNHRNGWETLEGFRRRGFELSVQWITPPFRGREVADRYGIIAQLEALGIEVDRQDGRGDPEPRVNRIRDRIRAWAIGHGLLLRGVQ